MTTIKIYVRPHCRKWILQRIDTAVGPIEAGRDNVLYNFMMFVIQNGSGKREKYPSSFVPLTLNITSRHLINSVDARKEIFIPRASMEKLDKMIDAIMEHELFYTAEIHSRCYGGIQKGIVEFMSKYDLDESELSLDAADKRIKRAREKGYIVVESRKTRGRDNLSHEMSTRKFELK